MATKVTTLTDQVTQGLQDAIEAGTYVVGTKLPSGKELGKIYGVSQAVIREVTASLRSQGPIDSRQGSRSEEHTSELQSLMRISYAVCCLKQKINNNYTNACA